MRRHQKGRGLAALFLALTFLVAACGGGGGDDAGADTTAPSDDAETSDDAGMTDDADAAAPVDSSEICDADALVEAVESGPDEGTLGGMTDDPVATAASSNPVLSALSCSGRLRVSVATGPSMSTSRCWYVRSGVSFVKVSPRGRRARWRRAARSARSWPVR